MNDSAEKQTQLMLTGGVIAGPTYILVAIFQLLIRDGFDITRHPLSFMSLGDLGWIQITNFIMTGALVLLAALALHRLGRADRRFRWAARFLGVYAVCVVAGGVFPPDPALGFPPGTPDIYPETASWHGMLHFIFGNVGFLSLIAASFVFARYFALKHVRMWSVFSALTGGLFIAAIATTAVTGNGVPGLISLYAAVALGWLWISAISVHMSRKLRLVETEQGGGS